jgi:hypothetical protein
VRFVASNWHRGAVMPMIQTSHHDLSQGAAMSTRPFTRVLSLLLSAVFTVAVMGAIDQLAQHEPAPDLWAQQASVRA